MDSSYHWEKRNFKVSVETIAAQNALQSSGIDQKELASSSANRVPAVTSALSVSSCRTLARQLR